MRSEILHHPATSASAPAAGSIARNEVIAGSFAVRRPRPDSGRSVLRSSATAGEPSFAADDGVGLERNLPAAARGVDHVGRHRIAGGVAAEALDDLQALGNRRAKMRRAGNRVALIKIIGADPHHQQLVHQFFHRLDVVVDPLEQHGLRAQGNAGVGQAATGLVGLGVHSSGWMKCRLIHSG